MNYSHAKSVQMAATSKAVGATIRVDHFIQFWVGGMLGNSVFWMGGMLGNSVFWVGGMLGNSVF